MNGELAVLYQGGKQVGGLYDWAVNLISTHNIRNGWREFKIVKKEITAYSYWLTLAPGSDCFEAQFYKAIQGQLVLIDRGKIEVALPNQTLDRRLYIPFEIRWRGN